MPRAPMCPFYGRTSHEDLVCLTGGAGTAGKHEMTMRFPTQVCRLRYWIDFCCQDWEKCSMAAALWREYERLEAKKAAAAAPAKAKEPREPEPAPNPEKKLRPTARRKKIAKKKAAAARRKAAAEKKKAEKEAAIKTT